MKYVPIISERKSTTLLEDPVPTRENAKKNWSKTEIRRHLMYKIQLNGGITTDNYSSDSYKQINVVVRHVHLSTIQKLKIIPSLD